MKRFDTLLKMFGRMTIYGLVLGGIAGALVGGTLIFTLSVGDGYYAISDYIAGFTFGAVNGAFFGGIYGSFGGLFSGLAMALVTAVSFQVIRNPRNFKLAMGTITGIVTTIIFFGFGLWDLGTMSDIALTWFLAMALSVVIAVYASQMTARKYIRQMTLAKEKAKAN